MSSFPLPKWEVMRVVCGRGSLWGVGAFLWWLMWHSCHKASTVRKLLPENQRAGAADTQRTGNGWTGALSSCLGHCPCASRHFCCFWGWGDLEWLRPIPLVQPRALWDLSCAREIIPCHWQHFQPFQSLSLSLTHLPSFDSPEHCFSIPPAAQVLFLSQYMKEMIWPFSSSLGAAGIQTIYFPLWILQLFWKPLSAR